jgi:ATP-dependent helicase Lhr and Lhr-like helicase
LIRSANNTLIAAPTGSGKTLAAFLVAIDSLVEKGLQGELKPGIQTLYISPLKALSNDIRKNLSVPLQEITSQAVVEGLSLPAIEVEVRTGDTTPSRRQRMLKKPPHILVTTPESLFLLLTSKKSREILKSVKTVIVDEIHALASNKRGAHLSLSLERLDHLCETSPLRVGLSATQKPLEKVAQFLTGSSPYPCSIVDVGHQRDLDLRIEVPGSELSAVCSNEQWAEIYQNLGNHVKNHRSTLVFVNTRKLAERVTFHLSEILGEHSVASHHGSLSKEKRHQAEDRLKEGKLKAIVATASLELGIDIGYVDLVCQVGSPRCIATFLQRVGRSGHAVGATPKGRLFALTRDELVESMALIHGIRQGILDEIEIPGCPLDILAQQIIAASCDQVWSVDELFTLFKGAYPYRTLQMDQFLSVVKLFSKGAGDKGSFPSYLHYDALGGMIKDRRSARLTALTNAGAIPEQALYRVINVEDGTFVGTVGEDFALERPAGHVFLLGNTSWQIIHTRGTQVSVRDAHGAPPTIPFWEGEAPGRTAELSSLVSDLRNQIASRLPDSFLKEDDLSKAESAAELAALAPPSCDSALDWLEERLGQHRWAHIQAVHYIAVQKAALGVVPTQEKVVFERFFDQSGGMQLVIHAPFGIRVNRAWGLALRKRFCRSFDFELQAVADDEGIVLSLGAQQSFPVEQLFDFLTVENIQTLLEQAFLQAPYFKGRWQWNANRSLAVLRFRSGKKIPPVLQKARGEDLLTSAFPDVNQCLEHISGDIPIPYEHPLVCETMENCLFEAADLVRLKDVLATIEKGEIELIPKDTREPSPFAYERLNAAPYAFLDNAPLEERRTRALSQRRQLSIEELRDLGALDEEILTQVRRDSWPLVRIEDELYETLLDLGVLKKKEVGNWKDFLEPLLSKGRVETVRIEGEEFLYAIERIPVVKAAYLLESLKGEDRLPQELKYSWEKMDALNLLIRARLSMIPVLSEEELVQSLNLCPHLIRIHLEAIEAQGSVLRGNFLQDDQIRWCDRRLLQRIHHLTIEGLRKRIRPVSPQNFLRYLFASHKLIGSSANAKTGPDLLETLVRLQGFETAAGEWEAEILPARVRGFDPSRLDELCFQGVLAWGRINPNKSSSSKGSMNKASPMAFLLREHLAHIFAVNPPSPEDVQVSDRARAVLEALQDRGAQFSTELMAQTRLLQAELDEALGELARKGLASADGFAAIRPLISKENKRRERQKRSFMKRFAVNKKISSGGRWSPFPGVLCSIAREDSLEFWAWLLLQRYGVTFRDLLTHESCAPPWSDLVKIYRRLELRGEIRGGRFISGVSGEQFGLLDAVSEVRKTRDKVLKKEWVVVSAADPLNLTGPILQGSRIASSGKTRLLFCQGVLTASMNDTKLDFLVPVKEEHKREMEELIRSRPVIRRSLQKEEVDDFKGNEKLAEA